MVGVLVRLRLTLLRNQARGGVEKVLLLVFGVLVAGGVGVVSVGALVALRFAPLDLAGAAVVAFGTLAVLAWLVLPVLTGTDEVMNDPARFALLPLQPRALAAGLLAASSVAPFAVVTLLSSLTLAVTFSRGPLPVAAAVVAVLAGLVGTVTCLLGARAVLTSAAAALAGRRGREVTIGIGVIVLSLLGLTGPALAELGERLETGAVDAAIQALAWTPLAAAWATPWAAAEGRWMVALGRGVVALVTVGALGVVYTQAVTARLRPTGSGRARPRARSTRAAATPVRPPRLVPDTPLGALVLRCLRYWVRDNRYLLSVLALPVVIGLLLFLPVLGGAPTATALIAGPVLGLLLAFTMLNELAFDGSALWTSIAAGVRGRDDRTARVVALLVWGAPVTVVVAVLGAVVADRHELAPAAVGLSVGILLVGNGVAAVSSVAAPFPVPPAGANPFAGTSGAGTAALVQQGLSALILFPVLIPLVAVAVWAWFVPVAGWLLVAVAAGYGTVVLGAGVRIGGDMFDRRGPELLARLTR